jgi:predicted GIY-YIG superfamily endonuclease
MSDKRSRVYILASKRNGTLYVVVTSDLTRRVWQHRSDVKEGLGQSRKNVRSIRVLPVMTQAV